MGELRLVASCCLLFEEYYMVYRTPVRNYWRRQIIPHLPLPLLRSTDGLPLAHTCEFIPELTQDWLFVAPSPWLQVLGVFGLCFLQKDVEPFKCFSHWLNASPPPPLFLLKKMKRNALDDFSRLNFMPTVWVWFWCFWGFFLMFSWLIGAFSFPVISLCTCLFHALKDISDLSLVCFPAF